MKELVLIRHGVTTWNQKRQLQGHLNVPLSPLGRWQAEQLAKRLAGETPPDALPDALYSSDLARARDTAEELAKVLGCTVQVSPALRERSFGIHQGSSWDEVQSRLEEARIAAGLEADDYCPPGGESRRQVEKRVFAFVEELERQHPGGRVWVVSHGGIIRMLLGRLLSGGSGLTSGYGVLNTGVSILERAEEGWQARRLNCALHLSGVEPPAEALVTPVGASSEAVEPISEY